MFIKKNDNKDFGPRENPPEGTQCARLIHIIDLGTQHTEFQGVQKDKRQVRLTWELVDTHMSDGRPFVIGKTFNASLYKSGLLNTIESMTGKGIEFEPDGSFNMASLLDFACMVTVKLETKGDKTYANLVNVSPLPTIKGKKIDAEPSQNHLINFGFDAFDQTVYDMVPKWVQAICEKSPEYGKAKHGEDIPF